MAEKLAAMKRLQQQHQMQQPQQQPAGGQSSAEPAAKRVQMAPRAVGNPEAQEMQERVECLQT
jgi:hypothetical protein